MLAREYNTLIEVWKQDYASDGYGGNVPSDVFVKKIYSKKKTSSGSKFQQFGISDFKNPVTFSIRGKNGLNLTEKYFVKYKGRSYMVKGIEDRNIDGMEINLLCDEL